MRSPVPESRSGRQFLLFWLPLLAITSAAAVFTLSKILWGTDSAYVAGFLFYWVVWCYLAPILVIGKQGVVDLIRSKRYPITAKERWLLFGLLSATVFGALALYFFPNIGETPFPIIVLALPIAVVAGAGEEILWRGVFISKYSGHLVAAYIIPTIWFTLNHISPSLVEWNNESWIFILSTLPLGLIYGLVAYRTRSIRWTTIAHIFISFLAFAEPVSTSIYNLITGPG